jgi:copper chaperone CopZ
MTMRTVHWIVPSLHCESCAAKIRHTLAEIDGVRLARVDVARQTIWVEAAGPEAFAYAKRRLAAAGYPCAPASSPARLSP